MKLMVLTDIEGVTGVTTYQQAEGTPFGQRMLMNDLDALLAGLLDNGEQEIVVYDEHTDGRNVVLDSLPEQVSVVCGKPLVSEYWKGIDRSYDGMVMLGFHARSGVAGALLPHSYSRKHLNIRVNGRPVGEIGIKAAMAGDAGVPVLLVTGDSAGMLEAEELLRGVRTVTVKDAVGEFEAVCHSPAWTWRRIREAAAGIVADPPQVAPLTFSAPVDLEVELAPSEYLEQLKAARPDLLASDNEVRLTAGSLTEAWMAYLGVQREVRRN